MLRLRLSIGSCMLRLGLRLRLKLRVKLRLRLRVRLGFLSFYPLG